MLFSVANLTKYWNIQPSGVLHVGAHEAEEATDYEQANWLPVVWVEGQSALVEKIRTRLDPKSHRVFQAFVWDISGEVLKFKQTNNSQSSSLLDFGTHAEDYPYVSVQEEYAVTTSCLEDVVPLDCQFEFINLDLQGVELQALKGLGKKIENAKWIYTEVNKKQVYKGCTMVSDLDEYLSKFNFKRVVTRWVYGKGWGDALYVRRDIKLPTNYILQRVSMSVVWNLISIRMATKHRILKYLHFLGFKNES